MVLSRLPRVIYKISFFQTSSGKAFCEKPAIRVLQKASQTNSLNIYWKLQEAREARKSKNLELIFNGCPNKIAGSGKTVATTTWLL